MAKQLHRPSPFIAGATTALAFVLSGSAAFASNGFKSDCDEVNDALPAVEIPTPSLTTPPLAIRVVEHGLTDSAADMKDPASDPTVEKLSSPALTEVVDVTMDDSSESTMKKEDDAVPVNNLPETALRLPGVSKEDQPRFRRQMYRTDI